MNKTFWRIESEIFIFYKKNIYIYFTLTVFFFFVTFCCIGHLFNWVSGMVSWDQIYNILVYRDKNKKYF